MEVKQHIYKKSAGYWRNQKGKFSRNKWQWKHNNSNLWDAAKAVLRGKFIAIQSYLKKQEKHRINNLILYLKQLEKEEKNSEISKSKVKVQVSQSCPTLCNPIDYTVHGILQARILEWVAFPFSRGSSQPKDQTRVSCIAGRFFINWAIREACRRRKEIIKIWAEINEKEMKETIAKINKTETWFFEKINKIDKLLARLIKKKREESNQQN